MIPTTKPLVAASLALAALALPGCNIVGPAVAIIEGPPTIPAQTELQPDRSHVIFVDDRANNTPRRSLRVTIGREAEETLIAEGVVEQQNMIAAQSALRVAMSEPADEPLAIADVGRAVGAGVVIYLTIDAWTLSKDGVTYSPLVAGRVKLIDAESRARLWPGTDRGFQFRVEPQTRAADLPSSLAERSQAHNDLAQRTGQALAKLFYESEKPSVGDR